jgi:hypothetical protein
MRTGRAALAIIILLLGGVMAAGAATAAPAPLLNESFSKLAAGVTWTDGDTILADTKWRVRFAGYGTVRAVDGTSRALRLAPAPATSPGDTHAALVVSQAVLTRPCINLKSRLRTSAQLRTGSSPNPWETGWLVWDFVDEAHFSYLALKPNGWELGKRDPAYPGGQRFLATGSTPTTAIGQWRTANVVRSAGTMTVKLDGRLLTSFTDRERPYSQGSIGMYTEDAAAEWDNIRVDGC